MPMHADELRDAFTSFWVERGHLARPSASLIPHDPTLLFTVAGMVPFKPFFLGEEEPPAPRVTTIQKCVRAGGKHNDLDDIGRTNRHLTFFEMMGNFSFGDYFKAEAIPWAWELVTGTLGLDPADLWVTVHVSDDDAERIWIDSVGVPPERVRRLDKDNWWAAGDTGPCGPCSEIFIDLGPDHGAEGGPGVGGDERYVEIWNLVFMQYDRDSAGELQSLPNPGIDTGAGFDRILSVVQGSGSVWDTDIMRPLLDAARRLTGTAAGVDDPSTEIGLRIIADHSRAFTFLVSDGVFPSNEDRGYVLRRIIRRAVRYAHQLGAKGAVAPTMVRAVTEVMGAAHPELIAHEDFVTTVVGREEERFARTLANGSSLLAGALDGLDGRTELPGDVAFKLHDTYGFPLELTEEIAAERGVSVERAGFDVAMAEQRRRAREAGLGDAGDAPLAGRYRELLDEFGPTVFVRDAGSTPARVLAVLDAPGGDSSVEIFLDRTTFYAEGGGQVGDVGTITTESGSAEVLDTTQALPGLHRHLARITAGHIAPGDAATAEIDAARRDSIRRNHTGTHVLHWALREVLGEHVKQAGSLVAPDRLRFDFNHFEAVTPEQLVRIEDLANRELLANQRVRHYETTFEHAAELGAIAFFGEKYGDVVRVLEAGDNSIELCGGTHVAALGDIGHLRIVSESSIGSNLRRIEAVTGTATIDRMRRDEDLLGQAAELLGSTPEEVADALRKRLDELRDLKAEVRSLQQRAAASHAAELAAAAVDGVVVARLDGTTRDFLRDLAVAVRDRPGVRAVVLGGEPDGGGASLVAAVAGGSELSTVALLDEAASAVQGGFNRNKEVPVLVAGGRDAGALDRALDLAREAAGLPVAAAS